MIKAVQIKVLSDYKLWIKFSDNTEGQADLSYLVGKGVFSIWKDYSKFKEAKIGSGGEIFWGNEIDLCADSLYLKITGKKPEEIFSNLKPQTFNA